MWRRWMFLFSASLLPLLADCPNPCPETKDLVPPCYPGGATIGITAMTTFELNIYFLTVGYFNDYFLFDFGANYEHIDLNPGMINFSVLQSHIGLRNRLYQNLFVSYGALGTVAVVAENLQPPRPYTAGAFVGIDFQAVKHWYFSVRIHPFYFVQDQGVKFFRSFESGSFNCSYVF